MKQTADLQYVEKGYSPNRSCVSLMLCVKSCLIPAQNVLFVLGENEIVLNSQHPSFIHPFQTPPPTYFWAKLTFSSTSRNGFPNPELPLGFGSTPDTSFLQPPLKPTMPSRPIAPAPPSTLSAPTKVPGQVTVTMESSIPQAPTIPVATISGQQVCAFCYTHCKVRAVQHWHSRSSSWSRREAESRLPCLASACCWSVLLGAIWFSYCWLFRKLLSWCNHPTNSETAIGETYPNLLHSLNNYIWR